MQGSLTILSPWLRNLIGTDVKALEASVRAALAETRSVVAYARCVRDELKAEEWAQLRAKGSYSARSGRSRMGLEFQVKGLIQEIAGIRRMLDPATHTAEGKTRLGAMRQMVK